MSWLDTAPADQRDRFMDDRQQGLHAMAELCARYGIRRKTGYEWLARYDAAGIHPEVVAGVEFEQQGRRAAPEHGIARQLDAQDLRVVKRRPGAERRADAIRAGHRYGEFFHAFLDTCRHLTRL